MGERPDGPDEQAGAQVETLGFLVTIQFQSPKTMPAPLAIRHWYHVPRKGELIDLPECHGYISDVVWADDKIVVVVGK